MSPSPPASLAAYGWDARVERAARGFGRPGRVTRVEYGAAVVRTAGGEVTADWTSQTSRSAEIVASPAVGDWVDVTTTDDEGEVLVAVADRWSALIRQDPADGHAEQVLAANVDVIFVVAAADRPLNVRRLDRMLAMAWGSGAEPVLVLTKLDLTDEPERVLATEVAGRASCIEASGVTGAGIETLRAALGPRTAVFLGPSGVGKSTLVNALSGHEVMDTADVRARDGKGRHTTTTRELWPVPGGGVVIDTPGIRGVQLWDPAGGVDAHFAELAELADQCRFRDCSHTAEPGCAVVRAVADGEVGADRVEHWLSLRAESDAWQVRQVEHDRESRRGGRRRPR